MDLVIFNQKSNHGHLTRKLADNGVSKANPLISHGCFSGQGNKNEEISHLGSKFSTKVLKKG